MNMVSTHELNEGDIITDFGIRLYLTNRRVHKRLREIGGMITPVEIVSFDGIVTNLKEVRAAGVMSMHMFGVNDDGERIWKVQGNHLAHWNRVKENA